MFRSGFSTRGGLQPVVHAITDNLHVSFSHLAVQVHRPHVLPPYARGGEGLASAELIAGEGVVLQQALLRHRPHDLGGVKRNGDESLVLVMAEWCG